MRDKVRREVVWQGLMECASGMVEQLEGVDEAVDEDVVREVHELLAEVPVEVEG